MIPHGRPCPVWREVASEPYVAGRRSAGAVWLDYGAMDSSDDPIFVDASGRRKRWTRRVVIGACLPMAAYLGLLATGVVTSSPVGAPPWVAKDPPKNDVQDNDFKPGGAQGVASPSASTRTTGPAKPVAGATRAPKAGGTPPATDAGQTSAAGSPAGGQNTGPATPSATTDTRPGNAPLAPAGHSNRPTAANPNKRGAN